jgi:hypothetical protein
LTVRAATHRRHVLDPRPRLVPGQPVDHRHVSAATRQLERHRVAEIARRSSDGDAKTVEVS